MANPRAASDSELLDVFLRITMRAKRGQSGERALAALDAELVRRAADPEPEVTPEQRRVEQLVAGGESWQDAYAEVYGRGRKAGGRDPDRRKGETAEQTRRRHYAEATYLTMLQAEEVTRGNLVTRQCAARGVEAAALFSGPLARARKCASEELQRFWAEVSPRRTYAEFRAERVGDTRGARAARRARATASNGRDFV